ncbi:MAG TPA: N-acetyltransferase [Edaphobacter sp.]
MCFVQYNGTERAYLRVVSGMARAKKVVLRGYHVGDLDKIVRLDERCFDEEFRFDRRSMKAYVEARNSVSLIAEKDDEMVGFVIVHIDRVAMCRRGYVVTLDVAAECRRSGLAGRMMQAVEMLAEADGAQRMELHVFTENDAAIRFYEWLGYERVARLRRFYGAEGRDAFEYRKALG